MYIRDVERGPQNMLYPEGPSWKSQPLNSILVGEYFTDKL